jgi:CheY-like chemotaxis protein
MKRTVLCIDDSSTALILLEYALNVLALSVKEAIQIINKQIPDLILLDLSMPAISGYEFLEMRAKLNLQKVPIIVVSAYDSKESVSKIQDLGAIDFISKPIRIETLMEKIRTHLKH